MTILLAIHVCFFVLVIGAMYTDMTTRKVPNWLTYPAICAGVVLNMAVVDDWVGGLAHSSKGFLLGFGVFVVLYALNALGEGGDVKLMGAIGALTGWKFTFNVILMTSIVGGAVAMLHLAGLGLMKIADEELAEKKAREADPPGPLEEREDGVPVHVVEVGPDGEPAPADGTDSEEGEAEGEAVKQTDLPAPKPVTGKQPTYIPYGLCIALGSFWAYQLRRGHFDIPITAITGA